MGSLIQLLDRPIAYQPSFAQLRAGKVKAGPVGAVLLSQLVYWHNRMDGSWIYKTRDQIAKETGLSRDEQETARKRLVALGVLEEELRGVPATMHFRINTQILEVLLLATTSYPQQLGATHPTRKRQHNYSVGGNTPNQLVETPPASWREPTQQVGGDAPNFHLGDYKENTKRVCQADELPDDSDSPDLKVLTHLNTTTRSEFQDGKTTLGFINGLLVGEYVADELILVTDYLAALWDGDSKMSQYLRPSTMFRLDNFEGYLPLAKKWDREGRQPLRNVVIDIDTDERDSAYKRFTSGSVLTVKTALEMAVRKTAASAGIKNHSPAAAKTAWDKIWVEHAGKINSAKTAI